MNKPFILFVATAMFLVNTFSFGQELARSASFGAVVSDLSDSLKTALKLTSLQGTLIKKVIPGSSAHKAGFNVNDVLVSMDGETIDNTSHFLQQLKKYHGGDKVKVGYYRKGKLMATSMVLMPKQMETSEAYDIIYSSVVSGKNHLRTIITKPKAGSNFPSVLIVGGVGCYSIDNPSLIEIQSIKMWTDSLTRNGFVTMRVEKTGMGDSKGIPCNECDFNTEMQGYLDGLKQLRSLAYVDTKNVFIAGFSIGGILAPLLAQEDPVKGIIVYGTVGRNWLEYELDNSLRQQWLGGQSADTIDRNMRSDYIRLYGLFVEKKMPEQIMQEHPETASNFFNYPMRTEYFQQVADVNVRELWMKTKSKVLALHGSSDFVSSGNEHKQIADIVNHYHPGNATYSEIPNSDHWGLFAESELVSYSQRQTELNPLPLTTSIKWLKENL